MQQQELQFASPVGLINIPVWTGRARDASSMELVVFPCFRDKHLEQQDCTCHQTKYLALKKTWRDIS
jgi:hypothetical protein